MLTTQNNAPNTIQPSILRFLAEATTAHITAPTTLQTSNSIEISYKLYLYKYLIKT